MPVPTTIADLSTTISSNSPAGTDVPSVLDDHLRAHAGFIAQLAAGTAFTGTITSPTAYRIGGATQGAFGRRVGAGSGATANVSYDDVVIDATGANVGISLLTDNTRSGALVFGDGDSATVGRFQYDHATNTASIWAAGAERVDITSAGLSVVGKITSVTEGAGSGATANTNYDNIVIDSENNAGISVLTGASSTGAIRIGRLGSEIAGGMDYSNATDTLTLVAGGSTMLTLNTSGVIFGGSSPAGYAPSSVTFETQSTNKTTAVTVSPVNPAFGIQMATTSMSAGATVAFTVNHASVGAGVMVIGQVSGSFGEFYSMRITNITSGSFIVRLTSLDSGSRAEAVTLEFILLSGPTP